MLTLAALCLLFCDAICTAAADTVSAQTASIDQVFEESYTVANRLHTIDLVFSFEQPGGYGPRAMRLRQRGRKLRGDAYFGRYDPHAEPRCVDIYDGTTLIKYAPATRQLGTTDLPTDGLVLTFEDPLCTTYRWLMELPLMSSLQTKSHVLWLERATSAVLKAPTAVHGIPCQCIEIPGANKSRVLLEIADGLRIPLKWTEFDSSQEIMNEVTVQEWKEYPTQVGTVVLPTVVDYRSRLKLKDGTFHENRYLYQVDISTVRVNEEIPEDVFAVPTSKVAELYDRDKEQILYPLTGAVRDLKEERNSSPQPTGMFTARTWLTGINLLLVAGLAAVWWFLRGRRTT